MADKEEKSESSLKSIWDFLVNLIAVIAGLLAIAASSGLAAVFAFLSDRLVFAMILFLIVLIVFLVLIVRVARYLRIRRAPPPKWLLRGYKLVEVEHLYEIHDETKIRHSQTSRYLLKALQYGVELFEVRYIWTGRGREEEPQIKSPGHNIVGAVATAKSADWRYYYIHFGRELMAKKETEITVLQEFFDEHHQFQPRLSKTIVEPVDRLILRVRMPARLRPINILCKELSSPLPNAYTIREEKRSFDGGSQEICWELKRVVLNHKYVITWDYA